jgi:outer membrane protein OmpA-like peptidoglycan-associated protein
LTNDGNELYFVADSKEGYGGRDIFLAKKNIAGDFENPVNAGSKVNTQGDELFPVIADDNKLYFSSNGKIGYGGLDIYVANKEGKIYTNAQNLGYGVNSGGDDFSIALIKSKDDSVMLSGYLTSNKPGGKGFDDIYYFEKRIPPAQPLPPAVYVLKVLVQTNQYENENNPNSKLLGKIPVENATVEIPRFDNVASSFQFLHSDKNGNTETVVIPKNSAFKIKASKIGFLAGEENVNANINAKDGDTIVIQKTITLNKIFKDVEITLDNIYYDYDKWNIRADAAQSLDTLIDILVKNPTIKIQLSSHTDCRGKDAYNETLSQKRAESVVQYLIQKGIAADRLTAKGYGETMPIEQCECTKCSDAQHQRNRRTTFKILSE